MRRHAGGGGVNEPVRARKVTFQAVAIRRENAFAAEERGQRVRESRRPLLVAIDDRELADTKTQRRMGDGRPSAAGAEQHHPRERYAREPKLEAAAEARVVSVVPDRATTLEHHR